ncbi:hypothetical protein GCM10010954_10390 [Halobacillus andaensis]|uniref:Uncharacterized protein n=1 Tax=Halobacillus andaensis TaxID=1176239 RepID=A0A917B0X7_HALAA|nr:hypothetical protein [Halobacillus andaensis]MBP2003830.1 hypothetical protein [Halobacillus andaensis]GGF13586.1 hypothetical protein GCM10010954_10390 [Halobacillus andaensis]
MSTERRESLEFVGFTFIVLTLFFGLIVLSGIFSGVHWLEIMPNFSRDFVNVEVFRDLLNFREN